MWPEPFRALRLGLKTAEYRYLRDRRFAVGDLLLLDEYEPEEQRYTGETERRIITRIDAGPDFGIRTDYGMLSMVSEPEGARLAVQAELDAIEAAGWAALAAAR